MVQILKRDDWTLFANINTLGQKAGVPKTKILHLVAKELTDNALDIAAEVEAGILSGSAGFYVQDNGAGIPGTDADLIELFSINRPLMSSKWKRLPTRGALGNGLRVAAGAMFSLDAKIRIYTRGRVVEIKPGTDGKTEGKRIQNRQTTGTRIEFLYSGNLPADVLEWSKLAINHNTGKTYTGKTSLYWYDTDTLNSILKSVPPGETIRQFLADHFDGCSGAKAGQITADLYGRDANTLTIEETDNLLSIGRGITKQVNARRIGQLGKPAEAIAYNKAEAFFHIGPARGEHGAQIPVILEAWAIEPDEREYRRGTLLTNRTPTIADFHFAVSKKYLFLSGCGIYHNEDRRRKNPAAVYLNINAPYIPITSDGKSPDLSQLHKKVVTLVTKTADAANRKTSKAQPNKRTQTEIIRSCIFDKIETISRGGKIRYSQRQLFYKVRPHIISELDKEPDYNYFCAVVTDIEDETGADLPGMLRDDRGVFVHPFDGEEIPLGTAAVEKYHQPEYQFSKVLYIEKRGLFQLLKDEKIPERYDVALMSSAGFANRAARDLIDLIGSSGEPIQFFCIHDADAAGTLIYDKLVNETKARGRRAVEIIDLGLDPREALEMDLPVEKVTSAKGKLRAVGSAYKDLQHWFQYNRVELDAMEPALFIEWIESKLNEHHDGKLQPPAEYLTSYIEETLKKGLRDRIEAAILEEINIEEQINQRINKVLPDLLKKLSARDLEGETGERLESNPTRHWTEAVVLVVDDILSDQK